MKILFINLPYLGHVVPTVGLVQELIRQGPGSKGGAEAVIRYYEQTKRSVL